MSILTFHFTLVHIPGSSHGPDGLSRRPRQPDDPPIDDDEEFEDWIDQLHGFIHIINDPPQTTLLPRVSSLVLTGDSQNFSEEEIARIAQQPPLSYDEVPRSDMAQNEDKRILLVRKWLGDLVRPSSMSDSEYATFLRYCMEFFLDSDILWRKDRQGAHKLVAPQDRRFEIMRSAHDDVGHKGFHATRAMIAQRFWWPHMHPDIVWFVHTCYLCQIRQTRQILIPPTVATPAPLFAKIYVDTMHMTPSGSFKFIVQGRCSLTQYPEFRMLRAETAKTLGDWVFEDIICRWGSLREIVTDNGAAFVKALDYLCKRYQINHIRISGYNSRANGLVERPHFDVRQSLYKAANGDSKRWSLSAHSVFWAERVTVRRRMGCSPYFAATGSHPIIPLDISEATYHFSHATGHRLTEDSQDFSEGEK
jgi:hypothetical protein